MVRYGQCKSILLGMTLVAFPENASAGESMKRLEASLRVSAGVTIVSDYRYRGVTLSNKKPAIQPEISIAHKSGVYVSAWGSNVANNGGDDIELDGCIGFSKKLGPVKADMGVTGYFYPGVHGQNYGEIYAALKTEVGPGTVSGSVSYAPRQANLGHQDNLYVGVAGEMPVPGTPVSLTASAGIEDGAFGNAKRDWSLGAKADVAGFSVGLKYVDAARTAGVAGANATAVVSVGKSF
jgi:uncharacterized protein (TIGR02001 family)